MKDDDECGAVSGMRIGSGKESTWRNPAPVPLCPPQIPHDLTWAGTLAAAVGSRRLTAWAMARLFSEMFVAIYKTTRYYNPEEHTLYTHRREILRFIETKSDYTDSLLP
jgi:hypothetical protein